MERRSFGRARGYIAPRVRRARQQARLVAGLCLLGGVLCSLGSYTLMGMAHSQRPDLTGAAMISGIAAFLLFILAIFAASEA